MGCGAPITIPFTPNELPGQGEEVLEMAETIEFDRLQLGVLLKMFMEIDSDESGFIQLNEISSFFNVGLGGSSILDVLLKGFDVNGNGTLCCVEFVLMIYVILSQDFTKLGELVYCAYFNKNGFKANREEVVKLFELIHNKKFVLTPGNVPTQFSISDFADICAVRDSPLTPLSDTISKMARLVFDTKFWTEQIHTRKSNPLQSTSAYLYKVRNQLNAINNRNDKAEKVKDFNLKMQRMNLTRIQSRIHMQSVLLTYFDMRPDKKIAAYETAEHSTRNVKLSDAWGRRRKSIFKLKLVVHTKEDGKQFTRGGIQADRSRKR